MITREFALDWNTRTGALTLTQGAYFMREEAPAVVITTDRDLPEGCALSLTLKKAGEFDSAPLWMLTGFTRVAGTRFEARGAVSSDAINALLIADANAANDKPSAPCALQVIATSEGASVASDVAPVALKNNAARDGDVAPAPTNNPRGAWDAGTAYVIRDSVSYNGSAYISRTSNLNSTPDAHPDDWQVWAQKGADGEAGSPGAALNPRGAWDAGTGYSIRDSVSFNGASYVAINAQTGYLPDSYPEQWQLIAAQGIGLTAAIAAIHVEDATARKALTVVTGQLVQQADRTRWECADATQSATDAGWWQLPDAPDLGTLFATHVSDISEWTIDGGASFALSDGRVYVAGTLAAVTSLTVSGGCNSDGDTALSLGGFLGLTDCILAGNGLTTLDVSACAALVNLDCSGNALTTLDVSATTLLNTLDARGNALADVDAILIALDAAGGVGGIVDVSAGSNAAPTSASDAAVSNLQVLSWLVLTHP